MRKLVYLALLLTTPLLARADWQDGGAPQATNSGNGAMISFEGALYFWNYEKGLLRSTNDGASWDDVSAKDNYAGGNEHVAMASASDGRIYAGYNYGSGNGLLRYSTDRGETWVDDTVGAQKQALGWPGYAVVRQVHAWAGHVFVGWDAPDAFDIKAFDGSFVRSSFLGQHDPMAVISYGSTLYVASDQFYYTTDFGVTWKTAAGNGYVPGTQLFLDGTRIYMLSPGSIDHANNIYYSDDFGENWAMIDVTALTGRAGTLGKTFATAFFGKGKDLWLGTQPKQFYGSRPNIFHSTDGGGSWVADTNGLGQPYYSTVLQLHYHPDGTLWVIPTLGNIYKQKIDGGTGSTLGAPEAITPANGSIVKGTEVTISWSAVAGATGYQIVVSTDSTFSSHIVLNDSGITATSRLVTGLTPGTQYYWRVRGLSPGTAHPKSGASPQSIGGWSSVYTFSTESQTNGVSDSPAKQQVQIYPNPAVTSVTVLSIDSRMSQIRLLDASGRDVWHETLHGRDRVTLNLVGLIRGAYHLIILTEDGIETQRSILVQ